MDHILKEKMRRYSPSIPITKQFHPECEDFEVYIGNFSSKYQNLESVRKAFNWLNISQVRFGTITLDSNGNRFMDDNSKPGFILKSEWHSNGGEDDPKRSNS